MYRSHIPNFTQERTINLQNIYRYLFAHLRKVMPLPRRFSRNARLKKKRLFGLSSVKNLFASGKIAIKGLKFYLHPSLWPSVKRLSHTSLLLDKFSLSTSHTKFYKNTSNTLVTDSGSQTDGWTWSSCKVFLFCFVKTPNNILGSQKLLLKFLTVNCVMRIWITQVPQYCVILQIRCEVGVPDRVNFAGRKVRKCFILIISDISFARKCGKRRIQFIKSVTFSTQFHGIYLRKSKTLILEWGSIETKERGFHKDLYGADCYRLQSYCVWNFLQSVETFGRREGSWTL